MADVQLSLAYCLDNQPLAESIADTLKTGGIKSHHIYSKKLVGEPALAEQLEKVAHPVLLLVSDNLLKSAACMNQLLLYLQRAENDIFVLTIPGSTKNADTGVTEVIPTKFERVSDIISYINYWQDQYLDLRRQKRQLDGVDERSFNEHLRQMRQISSEAGELLRLLRSMHTISYEQLVTEKHASLLEWLGVPDAPIKLPEEAKPTQITPPEQTQEVLKTPETSTATEVQEVTLPEEPIEAPSPVQEPEEVVEALPEEEPMEAPEAIVEAEAQEAIPEVDLSTIPGMDLLDAAPVEVADPLSVEALVQADLAAIERANDAQEEEVPVQEAPSQEIEEEDELQTALQAVLNQIEAGESEAGLAAMQRIVAAYPENTELRYDYALMLAQLTDNLDEARLQIRDILDTAPNHEKALYLAGELSELSGDFRTAENHYRKLIEINPGHESVHFRLGILLANYVDGSEAEATDLLMQSLENNPDNLDANYQLGILYGEKAGKYKKAKRQFKKVLELDENHPFANFDLAISEQALGNHIKAQEAYLRAAEINPEFKTEEHDKIFLIPEKPKGPSELELLQRENRKLQTQLSSQAQQISELEALAAPKTAIKTVLISGATAGIGRATAEVFAKNGHRVIMAGRRSGRLENLQDYFNKTYGNDNAGLIFDVRDPDQMKRALDALPEKYRKIDVLINNAGKARGFDPIHEGTLEHWDEMIDTNVKGLLYLTRLVSPDMVARQAGHIINVCSTAGKEVYPNGNVYCATKHAVDALTKGMRLDLHQHNIRVSQVSPAHVEETEFAMIRFDGNAERANIYEGFQPLKASNVAETIYFLATQPAYVNILDVVMQGVQQPNSTTINRSGREQFFEEE